MQFKDNVCAVLWSVLVYFGRCNAVSNAEFNASLRDYSMHEGRANTTDVRTLQKEYQRYASFAPSSTAVRFKAPVPDSAIGQSLSHGRGYSNHHGYSLGEYEESPHNGYGYEYHFPEGFDGHEEFHHHPHEHHLHHEGHQHGYGYHHKHFDHGLAAKTVLWPIAGIALLGAAAALVSNPILLQLGVVSGKRRRRDTDNDDVLEKLPYFYKTGHPKEKDQPLDNPVHSFHGIDNKRINVRTDGRVLEKRAGILMRKVTIPRKIKEKYSTVNPKLSEDYKDKRYVPIPLQIKD